MQISRNADVDYVIKVYKVSKSYLIDQAANRHDVVNALDQISFNVKRGEIVAFVGPNGCGKTTLIMCIAGVLKPDQGTIVVNGGDPNFSKIGFVFQNYREVLFPWRSNLHNLSLPLEIAGFSKREAEEQARNLLKELEWDINPDLYPYQLSGGYQQLLSIARALIVKPEIIFMDESLSSLDYRMELTARDKLAQYWKSNNSTSLFVSHNIEDAIYLADRIVLLSKCPAKVLDILNCDLPRPRTPDMVTMSKFLDLKQRILGTVDK